MKKLLVLPLLFILSSCYPEPNLPALPKSPPPRANGWGELVRGCINDRYVKTHNVGVVFMKHCVHWDHLALIVLYSPNYRVAALEAARIIQSVLGTKVNQGMKILARNVLRLPGGMLPVVVLGYKEKLKKPQMKPGKPAHF